MDGTLAGPTGPNADSHPSAGGLAGPGSLAPTGCALAGRTIGRRLSPLSVRLTISVLRGAMLDPALDGRAPAEKSSAKTKHSITNAVPETPRNIAGWCRIDLAQASICPPDPTR